MVVISVSLRMIILRRNKVEEKYDRCKELLKTFGGHTFRPMPMFGEQKYHILNPHMWSRNKISLKDRLN